MRDVRSPTIESPSIERYVSELHRALRGSRRDKRGLIDEFRDGLTDAASAQMLAGASPEQAARLIIRQFGPVAVLASEYQRELAVRQLRRTSGAVALTTPALIAIWTVIWSLAPGGDELIPRSTHLLAAHLTGLAAAIAVFAAAVWLLTGRIEPRINLPGQFSILVAIVSLTGVAAMASGCLGLAFSTSASFASPAGTLATLAAVVPLSLVTVSARRCISASFGLHTR